MIIFWLAALIIFAAVEVVTVGLASIWFAVGALAALIAALIGAKLWLQIAIFIVVTAVTLIVTRPFAKKFLNSRRMATNADRVLSMVGIVREPIDNLTASGTVTVGGREWTARSLSGEPIPAGTSVRPMKIEGVKLIVVPVSDNEDQNLDAAVET